MKKAVGTITAGTALALVLAACGNGHKNPEPAAVEQPAAAAEAPVFDSEAAEAIMSKPMDGSSLEAFNRDLEAVKAAAAPEDYQLLKSSLDALLFYNVSVAGDRARLYQSLDGLTPREIMEQAQR